ncbi:MAG: AraC family transcriptional regulator ligand-binding domain-containing protein [Moraxellaceae bacterium]|nr:AraC family transcriptional regulator ligand-binding domain-containing protein [Moraxellaceae bacterium]MDZ4297637.1 AraC family transcriptional regulator ligand-binding domain-containing protein [Moraxellaceae bacterium]MDZ4385910.1 AraC family transcriptional regulator ligand-binding domain-containing protein [Moraxellaceae bacterium]
MEDEAKIPARYFVKLQGILADQGIDFNELLTLSDISPLTINKPDGLLRMSQVERLIENGLRVASPDSALTLAKHIKLSSHSMVGYAMLSSPTVEYALRLAARFFNLILPSVNMVFRRDEHSISLYFSPTMSMSTRCLHYHLETIAASVHWELHELLQGKILHYDLYLGYPKPSYAERYKELQGARCHFSWDELPGIKIVYPVEIANYPLMLSDSSSLQMAEEKCQELVKHAIANRKLADWVSMMLNEAKDCALTLEDLAHTLNMSVRTLDRHLKSEQTNFRDIKNTVRHQRALKLLNETDMSVTQIAYELGYTDPANFTRAFSKVAGVSPSHYKALNI